AVRYIKIFTSLPKDEIDSLVAQHAEAPHLRILQKKLAEEVTVMVHSREDYDKAVEASQILFGGGTADALRELDEATLLDVFNGVQTYEFSISENMGARLADMLVDKMPVFPSKGEMRKLVQNNGFSINKVKITDPNAVFTEDMLLGGKYVLVQKGKKNYVLLIGA
ncbi:MAG: tyrosine--tRNA ligase, partial [Paludibacteraceae bacterium]|nr:tyrosine--tRNA ligase [Paludibacteraceae bacterium]